MALSATCSQKIGRLEGGRDIGDGALKDALASSKWVAGGERKDIPGKGQKKQKHREIQVCCLFKKWRAAQCHWADGV